MTVWNTDFQSSGRPLPILVDFCSICYWFLIDSWLIFDWLIDSDLWRMNFAYGTLASLEEDGQTFLAAGVHCNPVLDKERSSLNSCKLVYLLWLWYPLTSNWRCSRSHPHLRRMAFVAGIKKWRWYASSFTACDITICFASAFASVIQGVSWWWLRDQKKGYSWSKYHKS